jgi:hypothetical protein
MFRLQKIAAATLVALAGAAGLLVVAGPASALAGNDVHDHGVSVLAGSPWDQPNP